MSEVEFLNYLDIVSKNSSYNPKYVLFMPLLFKSNNRMDTDRRKNNFSIRLLPWHIQSLNAAEAGFTDYLEFGRNFLAQITNKGFLSRYFFPQKPNHHGSLPSSEAFSLARENSGFLDLDSDPNYGVQHARHTSYRTDPKAWQKQLRKLNRAKTQSIKHLDNSSINDAQTWFLELYLTKISALGAVPIVIFTPDKINHRYSKYYAEFHPEIRQILLQASNDSFLNKNMWFDQNHLSLEGANVFSSFIYSQLCGT